VSTLLASRGVPLQAVNGVSVATVVPSVQPGLEALARRLFGVAAVVVRGGADSPIPLDQEQPERVGPDRIANAVAAVAAHGAPVIVIDFGTATNIDCVSVHGRFVGGAIAPGIVVGAEALFARAARLARVDLAPPAAAIGRDTTAALRAGIVYGYAGLVDGILGHIASEMEGAPPVVATGGLSALVAGAARRIDHVRPHLTLEGLRLIHARAPRATPWPSP
jgi:type III pantothenate kinase